MRSRCVFTSLFFPFALAGLLLASGCSKHAQQTSQAPGNAPQQASAPAPLPDQTGGATAAPSATPGTSTNGAPAPTTSQNAQNTPPPQPPPNLVIPTGTHISVTTHRALGSKISEAGETFTATVARPIVVDGQTAIPRGARATGTVVQAKSLGRFKGEAHLELRLETVRVNGGMYRIRSNGLERVEQGKGKRSAGFIGGGAGLGAIIGGIAGGGKGALVGGLVGGGAGTAGAGLTGKKDIYIPAETTLTFRLLRAVSVSQ
ncbi:MAG: hypothetical protein WAM66_00445 [Acidobacteriaceae bacterium]